MYNLTFVLIMVIVQKKIRLYQSIMIFLPIIATWVVSNLVCITTSQEVSCLSTAKQEVERERDILVTDNKILKTENKFLKEENNRKKAAYQGVDYFQDRNNVKPTTKDPSPKDYKSLARSSYKVAVCNEANLLLCRSLLSN